MIDIEKIKTLHMIPFLLVDRVEELDEHKYIKAYKTFQEPFFTGHFPNNQLCPGVNS